MAEKLVVVPEQLFKREREEDIERRKTVYPSLTHIEDDITQLLDTQGMSSYEKVKLLGQLQQRYKGIYATRKPLKLQFENVVTEPKSESMTSTNTDHVFAEVMSSIPRSSMSKAAQIMSAIKASSGRLDWDLNRRLVVDGSPIENSNVVELIKNASSRTQKVAHLPGGSHLDELLTILGISGKKAKAKRTTPYRKSTYKKTKKQTENIETPATSLEEWEEQ